MESVARRLTVTQSEAQTNAGKSSRPRGQTPNSQGHGRTLRPHLPIIEEWHALPSHQTICPQCAKPYVGTSKTEDSDIIEINVAAHVRRIKRQCYRKGCDGPNVPFLITAPPAPRLIPKSSLGVSVWVEVLLQKYQYSIPTNRLCTDLKTLGAPISQGTLTGGLQKLAPLFEPLCEALMEQHLTERLFHGDESVPRRRAQKVKVLQCSYAAQEMRVGPSESPYRRRLQTAYCCCV